jgi:hypothetical protein
MGSLVRPAMRHRSVRAPDLARALTCMQSTIRAQRQAGRQAPLNLQSFFFGSAKAPLDNPATTCMSRPLKSIDVVKQS